jgi:glycosyltransferase involved in cell wall biosynthesis
MQGAAFLEEQLTSIAGQTFSDWNIWVSDDGSQDGTIPILEAYRRRRGVNRLTLFKGPGRGFVANFLSLVAREEVQAAYYAYADQDDVWEPDKLQRALDWLTGVPAGVPALYCGRTRLISEAGHDLGLSPLFSRRPGFQNALVQSIAGGNTMVFNHAARMLLVEAGQVKVVTHDWWTYLLVSACGGVVHYDPYPTVCYRQHGNNIIGSNAGWGARMVRGRLLYKGRFRKWNDEHIAALQPMRAKMPEHNSRLLDMFIQAREGDFFARLAGLRRTGIYRQTNMGNLGLYVAAAFGKV